MFRKEQSEPERFYSLLAEDTCDLLEKYMSFDSCFLVDVGGGPGFFASTAAKRGAVTVTVDVSEKELRLHGRDPELAVVGDGSALPFKSDTFDLVHASNVLEHVAAPQEFLEEIVRVTRPSGLMFVSFTVWLSPWGGHETSPWHLLGGDFAARRYEMRHGRPPKNRYLESLYPLYIADFERMLKEQKDISVLEVFPRYYPSWTDFVAHIPVVREFATWNYAVILAKNGESK